MGDGESGDGLVCREAGIAPTHAGSTSLGTLTMCGCNDCTLARLLKAVQSDPQVVLSSGFKFPAAPFTDRILDLNVVGLRVKASASNKFDDRMVVFYRPIHLDSPTQVSDPHSSALKEINVPQVEAFLKDPAVAAELKLDGSELPGNDSVDIAGNLCRAHQGWKILKYTVTTDPGQERKPKPGRPGAAAPEPSGVPVGDSSGGYLAQGRAVLRCGVYPGSHRLGLHHGTQKKGYTAGSQTGNVSILRAYTGKVLNAKVKAAEKTWEKDWKAYRARHPTAEPNDWFGEYLQRRIGDVTEVRDGSLYGTVIGATVTADYTPSQVAKNPAKPAVKSWVFTVNPCKVGARTLADTDVVVLCSTGVFGINIHCSERREDRAASVDVYNWSEGCQVFTGREKFKQFRRLVELSKRARCPRRRRSASEPCPSLDHPELTLADVLCIQFAHSDEKDDYPSTYAEHYTKACLKCSEADGMKMMDELLARLLADGRLDEDYVEEIQGKVDAIAFNDAAASGNVTSPRPKIPATQAAKAARNAALKETLAGHLIPEESFNALRAKIGTSELRTKLEDYVQRDVEREPAVKSTIDAKIATLAKGRPKKTVLRNAEVAAAVKAAEAVSQKRKLDKLAAELDLLTTSAKNKADFTINGIKRSREEVRKGWVSEGFEVCDFLWQCKFRLSYILVEVDKSFVDEIDKRYPSP